METVRIKTLSEGPGLRRYQLLMRAAREMDTDALKVLAVLTMKAPADGEITITDEGDDTDALPRTGEPILQYDPRTKRDIMPLHMLVETLPVLPDRPLTFPVLLALVLGAVEQAGEERVLQDVQVTTSLNALERACKRKRSAIWHELRTLETEGLVHTVPGSRTTTGQVTYQMRVFGLARQLVETRDTQ